MPSPRARRSLFARLPVLVLCACGSREPSSTPPVESGGPTVAPEDVGLILSFVNLGRTIDRLSAQYGRFVATNAAQSHPAALPAPDAARDTLRLVTRNLLFREILAVPGDYAIDLAAPSLVGVLLPRGGDPTFAVTVPVLSGGPPPRRGPRGPEAQLRGLVVEPAGENRIAIGYDGGPAADLAAVPALAAPTDDDFLLQLWGVPGAERAKRALLAAAHEQRQGGEVYLTDEILITAASALLDIVEQIDELRLTARIGEPDQPAFSARLELTPVAGTRLASALPPDAPTGDPPFVAAVPAGAVGFSVSRASPGDDVLLEMASEGLSRMFTMFERLSLPELTANVARLGTAARDLLGQLDGRWLDASWNETAAAQSPEAALADDDLFLAMMIGLLPQRTLILGVRDEAAALDAARRGCTEIQALGEFLDEFFGGPLDVGCQREAGAAGEVEIDALTLREKLAPGDIESGRRPWSTDIYFAAANGRLVLATGDGWQERLDWALRDAAPDGGLGADPRWSALVDRAPEWATTWMSTDLVSSVLSRMLLGDLFGDCGALRAGRPETPVVGWAGVEDGRGIVVVETSPKLAESLAELLGALEECGVGL
jgi:hypothetical protein